MKQPDDITTCPLCDQVLTDPDVLPCLHAFCSSCLDDWYRENGHTKEKAHCPLCNTTFMIFHGAETDAEMFKNRFVMKLLDLKRIVDSGDEFCVLCLSEKIRAIGSVMHKTATTYCIDCR